VRLSLAGAIAGVALLACAAPAAPTISRGGACAHPAAPVVIAAARICLKPGSSCTARFARQYARYGYVCVAGRLTNRPPAKTPPPSTAAPIVTVPAPPSSKAGAFAGSWWAIDPTDGSLEEVTFGDDGSIAFSDDFATVCGGAAGYALSTGSAAGNTWTASMSTTLTCPDNDGTVPDLLFQFTLNANGTLTFIGMPEIWTRSRPPTG
jgi:hypothetical protein